MEIGSQNREFEKSKVASNQTCFTVEWFYKIQEGRQKRYITLFYVWTIFIYQQNVHLKQNENLRDLSQFRQNKNQYCIDTYVCDFAQNLDCIFLPLTVSEKKYPVFHGLKEQQNFLMCYGKSLKE